MITDNILILGFLLGCAIVLVSFFLAFMDGAKQYERPDFKRELHSDARGKDVFYRMQEK